MAEADVQLRVRTIPRVHADGDEFLFLKVVPDFFNFGGPRPTTPSVITEEIDEDDFASKVAEGVGCAG